MPSGQRIGWPRDRTSSEAPDRANHGTYVAEIRTDGVLTGVVIPPLLEEQRRPQLVAALAAAHLHENCPVAVSKLDRLSRDARFISRLVAQGAPFFAVELGADADPLMLPLFATLVEKQRATISLRTTAALAAAKAGGAVLGNPRLAEARAIANAHHKAGADTFAEVVAPALREAQAAGARSLREIAAALNGRGIATARGRKWQAQTVANMLRRVS